jgi:hypothetical protein
MTDLIFDPVTAVIKFTAGGIIRVIRSKLDNVRHEVLVASYGGYSRKTRSSDDKAVRDFLLGEIDRGRRELRSLIEAARDKQAAAAVKRARECIDELDGFQEDVRLGARKRAALFFDDKAKIDADVLDKLKQADLDVIEKLSIVAETAERLATLAEDGQQVDFAAECSKLKPFLRGARALYRQRITLMDSAA